MLEAGAGTAPAVRGDGRADLVHFCHGAPGLVFAFAAAAEAFGDARFRAAALRAADVTWRFGILRKGPGLCHGVAGNGYALLAAFRLTRDPRWLHRAGVFAEAAVDADLAARSRTPDHPLSLFEGLAGTACFLRDLRAAPLAAELPFFELNTA